MEIGRGREDGPRERGKGHGRAQDNGGDKGRHRQTWDGQEESREDGLGLLKDRK